MNKRVGVTTTEPTRARRRTALKHQQELVSKELASQLAKSELTDVDTF